MIGNKRLFYIIGFFLLLTVTISMAMQLRNGNYAFLFLLPLTFTTLYPIFIKLHQTSSGRSITIFIVFALSAIRLFFIPFYGALTGVYENYMGSSINLINQSIILIIYEHLAVTFLLIILSRKQIKNWDKGNISIRGSNVVYFIFLVFVLFVYIIFGRNLDLFDFVVKPINLSERGGDITDIRLLIISQILSSGIIFLFFIIVDKIRTRYILTHNHIYVVLAILLALIMVSIIVGERRTVQLYVGFASSWTLIRLFPSEKKKIGLTILGGVVVVLLLMTIYKHFNAFLYDSYLKAVQTNDIGNTISALTLDSYFYGIDTVSKNLEFIYSCNLNLSDFIYDIFRNTFGINYFVDKNSLTLSQQYNFYLYSGSQLNGYLFSSIIYGFAFWGQFFAPLTTLFNVLVTAWLEKKFKTAKSIEMNYIYAYIFMRFAFGLFGNLGPLLNLTSRFLIINFSIFLVAKLFLQLSQNKRQSSNVIVY